MRNNNLVVKMVGFNEYNFPYLFIKDTDKISLVNLATGESIAIAPQNYQT